MIYLTARPNNNWTKNHYKKGSVSLRYYISLHSISCRCFWLAMATLELSQLTMGLLTSCVRKRKNLRGNDTEETTKRIKWKNYQFSELCGKPLITSIFRIFLVRKHNFLYKCQLFCLWTGFWLLSDQKRLVPSIKKINIWTFSFAQS